MDGRFIACFLKLPLSLTSPAAMLAKAALPGGTAFAEFEATVSCYSYSASSPQNAIGSWRRRRHGFLDSLARKSRGLSNRPSDSIRLAHFNYEDLYSDTCLPHSRCKMRDGFVEGGDGEGTANDCLAPSKDIHKKEDISVLWSLVQDIEPLDVSRVGQDVSTDSKDAMKRTISGMLGLLPSDRFHVTVEASREPLARLLISSVMTGYTLRNAEYRVCLHRSLELTEAVEEHRLQLGSESPQVCSDEKFQKTECLEETRACDTPQACFEEIAQVSGFRQDSLGRLAPEVENYISHLKSRLSSVTKELEDCKRRNNGLDMNSMVGDEKNDLLDYLRSLDAEKVTELSQPSSSEVEEVIRQVVSGILETMCLSELPKTATSNEFSSFTGALEQDDMESQQFQSSTTTTRDYLARLLFWCMLFGHHIRGLEYRLELSRTLSLCGEVDHHL